MKNGLKGLTGYVLYFFAACLVINLIISINEFGSLVMIFSYLLFPVFFVWLGRRLINSYKTDLKY